MNHGTITCYTHNKCRCDACRAAKSAAKQRYLDKRGRRPRGNPVSHDGVIYPSETAAAKALGVTQRAISYHLNKYGHLGNMGKRMDRPDRRAGNPVRVGSREWKSRAALARYLGRRREVVRDWVAANDMDSLIAALMKADAANVRIAA